jgi:hypothetical protein
MSEFGYIDWLRGLVGNPNGPYADLLFQILWDEEFTYYIPNDKNRAMDGLALRNQFESETSTDLPYLGECRMLELIVSIAIRMNEILYDHEAPDLTPLYFDALLINLNLYNLSELYVREEDAGMAISDAVTRINDRTYDYDGSGGLFPLTYPDEDQRKVEIWYQLHAYLAENEEL